ncbi:hypothetical protein ACIBHY_03050 [Nonomuraea sp. NPDC050547]|uniref:hypothetical protein n=1 Tax=Nonomuraea sp. NPDC050547 TaxID=3364368 RepID=UPI0037AFF772
MRRRSAALAGLLALAALTATPTHSSAETATPRGSETAELRELPPAVPAASSEAAGMRDPSPAGAPPDVRLPPATPAVTTPPATSSTSEAPSSPVAPSAAVADPVTISSRELSVSLDPAFPRVLGYTDRAGGATLGGSTTAPVVVLNGTPYPVTGTLTGTDGKSARYRLTFAALGGVALEASVGVRGRTTTFRIDKVTDTAARPPCSGCVPASGTTTRRTRPAGPSGSSTSPAPRWPPTPSWGSWATGGR